MMGHKSAQMEMLLFNPEELIPTNHQLRRIDRLISFGFVYDLFKDKYSEIGKKKRVLKREPPVPRVQTAVTLTTEPSVAWDI